MALTQHWYLLQDSVLYHIEPDCTLGIIPPVGMHQKLFEKAHGGPFCAHLGEIKVQSQLSCHYGGYECDRILPLGAKDVWCVQIIF